jgi:hypothetical protein
MQTVTIDRWSLERPSLAYHYAFDLCAVEINCLEGPVIVFASSVFYARELVQRLTGDVVLHFTNDWVLNEAEPKSTMGPEIDWDRVRFDAVGNNGGSVSAVLWAEPEAQTWETTLRDLGQLALPETKIGVIGTTRLRCLLPEWQETALAPARAPLHSSGGIARALRSVGYTVEEIYGFHGPLSLLSGIACRFSAALRRVDLVDRCSIAMRQNSIVRGWQARWAPIWVLIGRHGRNSNTHPDK